MPWTPQQAHDHKRGLSDAQARQWAEVANSVREQCLTDGGTEADCDAQAVRQANGVVGNVENEKNMNTLTCHRVPLSQYQIRAEQYQGRRHLVVPAVFFVEGVHHGSQGPILYTADELAKFPAAWNGRPVPIFHPEDGDGSPISCNDPQIIQSQSVGNVFNTYFEDGKLKGEVWIDEGRIEQISPKALSYIRTGRPLEVSTGVFTDDEPVSGNWNGEQYIAIARNLRPDHLALLPGGKGACSWEDGCGIRSNQKEVVNVSDEKVTEVEDALKEKETTVVPAASDASEEKGLKALFNRVYEKLSQVFGDVNAQEMSYDDIITKLQMKLDGMDSPTAVNYIRAVYEDHFVYEVKPGEQATGTESKLYRRDYAIAEDGNIELDDELIPVAKQIEYIEITDQSNHADNTNGGELQMAEEKKSCCPEKVTQLIENAATKFTEDDREWLQTLEEAQIDKMIPEEKAPETNEIVIKDNKADDKASKEQKTVVSKETQTPVTFKDLLENADPKVKEKIEYGFQSYDQRKTDLIQMITAHEANSYTEEELGAIAINELEKLGKFVGQPKVNYQGQGGITNADDNTKVKPMSALGFNTKKE